MSIPALQVNGELPSGQHEATLDEVEAVYGLETGKRQLLMRGLREGASNLARAGVTTLWINGSFVTAKPIPSDIDGCWEYQPEVDIDKLDPVFLASREHIKASYGLDFFISNIIEAGSGLPFPGFFQLNRDGEPKGIIIIKLRGPS